MIRWILAGLLLLSSSWAQAFWGCPSNEKSYVTAQDLEKLSFWNLCTADEISLQRANLQGTPALTPKALEVMNEAAQPQKSLVRVSSKIYDIVTEKWVLVEGVGSIVAVIPENKIRNPDFINANYYVLTAHHIAAGLGLEVKDFQGKALPLRVVTHDFGNDMSLVQLDTQAMARLLFPFAIYLKGAKANPLVPAGGAFDRGSFKNTHSQEVFKVSYIEGLDGLIQYGRQSAVPMAPWLADKNVNEGLGLPIFSRQDGAKIALSFAKGFSGTPVMVSYMTASGSHYELSGVLSTSTEGQGISTMTSSAALRSLFDQALAARIGKTGTWFLFDGSFVKVLSEGSSEVFIRSGPIGNGLAVDGFVSKDRQINFPKDEIQIPNNLKQLAEKYQQEKQLIRLEESSALKIKILQLPNQEAIRIQVK